MDVAGWIGAATVVLAAAVGSSWLTWRLLRGRPPVPGPAPAAGPQPSAPQPGPGEALTQAILDAAVDAILIIDAQGTVRSLNRAAERLFGYAPEEVVGRNVAMLMPEPHRTGHDSYIRRYLETGEARIIGAGREVQGLRKDGSTFPMELAVGEAATGNGRLFAGIVRDLTLRKETTERLLHREAQNRAILEAAVDGIITIDERGRIESFNRAAERIFGYSAAEVLGRNVAMLMPAPYRQEHDGYLARYLETGGARVIGSGREVQGLRKDGSTFPMELAVGEGFVAGRRIFAGTVRDITERKAAEDLLRRAKEEAERANAAKTRFLAAASHDLRQPVQSLVFFTAALAAQLAEGTRTRSMVNDMELAVDAMKMLLDALLDVSKLDAGVITPKLLDFPIDTLLATMRVNFSGVTEQRGLDLRLVPSTAMVRSDPALLGRLVQNLLENAVRYTQQGAILLGCRRRGGALRIEVWDTGIGIPPELTGEIFEEFTQVGNSERDRTQGLGLGLAIVKRLARLMGHEVGVRSLPGRGSVFWVEVPRVEPLRPPAAKASQGMEVETAHGTIVLIDDEPVVLSSLRALLQGWGYDVVAAQSEDEAVRMLRNLPRAPSMILADYRLKEGRTGTEAIRALCELYHRPIPSIILTGDTAPERIREAEASGISILHKPVTPPELLHALTETIGSA